MRSAQKLKYYDFWQLIIRYFSIRMPEITTNKCKLFKGTKQMIFFMLNSVLLMMYSDNQIEEIHNYSYYSSAFGLLFLFFFLIF